MPNITATASTNNTEIAETTVTWLPNGCPTWCEYGELHRSNDHYLDRTHFGVASHLPLSLEPRIDADQPATIGAHINQHYREVEPRVWVGLDESNVGKHLTLDETREFALRLLELVKVAEEEPAWRKTRRSAGMANCVEVAKVPAPIPGDCFGHCCACGGDGRIGEAQCGVCGGTGRCGH